MEGLKFVKEPPDDYSCMICAKLLDEPHLTDCCGQHFCQLCLERWFEKQRKKLCPHCRSESFTHMRYLPLKRKIDSFQVYCTYQDRGCKEITTVGLLKSHQDGCGFAPVACSLGCEVKVLRRDLDRHCRDECAKRRIRCEYCGKEDHYKTIVGAHKLVCQEFPVDCPKGCILKPKMKRKDVTKHSKICPLEEVHCDFHEVGCGVRVLRKDLSTHLESNTQLHLKKMMEFYREENKLQREENKLFKEEQKNKHEALKEEYKILREELKKEHELLKEECKRLSSQVEMLTLAEPVKLSEKNSNFTFSIPSSEGWISPPFYILDGYKFCIKHKHGNKASLLLLKGERDDKFKHLVDLEYEMEVHFNYFKPVQVAEPVMLQLPLHAIQESAADMGRLVTTVQQNKELHVATMTVPRNACRTGNVTVKLVKKNKPFRKYVVTTKTTPLLPPETPIGDIMIPLDPFLTAPVPSVDTHASNKQKCCPSCGFALLTNTVFCIACGRRLPPV